jgi:2',3'-cyclic-nucleotide 2'-phosphodiesterase (5'-nucleotidase family)
VILSGAGLLACSSYHITNVSSDIQSLDSHVHIDQTVDQLISPYRDTLQNEMGNVVATSPLDMVVGRPSSVLGNWVADALFVNQTKAIRLRQPVMCLLNTGGIRSTINKGDITLGDMYRIMPFDNEVVWLELPATSLAEIEREIKRLAIKARDGKMTPEDMSGGTFTITNGGVFGSMLSTPIINPPQSAILGMHNVVERPVAINGKVEIRPIMYVALSYDHRIIDGKESVGFLVKVKEMLENPERMIFGSKDPMQILLGL